MRRTSLRRPERLSTVTSPISSLLATWESEERAVKVSAARACAATGEGAKKIRGPARADPRTLHSKGCKLETELPNYLDLEVLAYRLTAKIKVSANVIASPRPS